MNKTRNAMLGLVAAASILTLAATAQAQNGPPSGVQHPPMAGQPGDRRAGLQDRMQEMRANMEQRQEHRAKALHDILQITPAQDGAWTAYQASMKPPARPEPGAPGERGAKREDLAALTTPQRLDKMLEMASRRQAEIQARVNSTKRFYAQLSPAQQRAFDALPGAIGGREGGPDGGRMGGHRGGPGGEGHKGPGGPGGEARHGPRGGHAAGPPPPAAG